MLEISPIAMFLAAVTVAAAQENAAAKPGSPTTLVTGNHASLEITGHIKVNPQPVGLSTLGAAEPWPHLEQLRMRSRRTQPIAHLLVPMTLHVSHTHP